ncbi:LOW QUALITY PROTEIN: hypothetical protein JCM24511_10196 [Saitozyma sp. JCM 24511]|nr:LOW QUALITY PROTEIN: hypothetical protein JCM24511_10196 [Saitozyma sp. JCM 24511]
MGTPSLSAGDGPLPFVLLAFACIIQAACVEAASVFNCVGPTLLSEIHSNICITTVVFTAGDAGMGLSYVQSREAGNGAAYAQMVGVNNSYTDFRATFGGQSVLVRTLAEMPQIQMVFIRLPDGGVGGNGFPATGLYFGQIHSIDSIDGEATFTVSSLREALSQILVARAPQNVRTLDYLSDFDCGDHSDHLTVARITAELAGTAKFVGYMGYTIQRHFQDLPPTLSTTSREYQNKTTAYFAYTPYDYSISACVDHGNGEDNWLQREYIVTEELAITLPTGINIAVEATATASSQLSSDQAPSKVFDNVVGGYPGDPTVEWVSAGEGPGAWITLAWDVPVVVQNVVLYDRPNWDDWLQSGYLTFDDGSTVTFAITHNDPGTASMVPLSQTYTTRSITLTVTAVAPSTQNVGLAEFRVYGSKCATCTSPTASYSASAPGATATDSAAATALHGTADASNNNLATFQTSDMAIDDVIGGYSGDPKIEWASIGEGRMVELDVGVERDCDLVLGNAFEGFLTQAELETIRV